MTMRGVYGTQQMPGRGVYATPAVGASVLQTPGGVVSEISRINDDINMFGAEVERFVTSLPGFPVGQVEPTWTNRFNPTVPAFSTTRIDPKWQPLYDWYSGTWLAFRHSWNEFWDQHGGSGDFLSASWRDNFWWNHAPEAEQFGRQLVELRKAAEELGMSVSSPEPSKHDPSWFDPDYGLPTKAKDAASDVWKMAKIGIYGALVVGGIIALSSIAQNLRNNRDPADKYLSLVRRR